MNLSIELFLGNHVGKVAFFLNDVKRKSRQPAVVCIAYKMLAYFTQKLLREKN
jgi:hypothetical protein